MTTTNIGPNVRVFFFYFLVFCIYFCYNSHQPTPSDAFRSTLSDALRPQPRISLTNDNSETPITNPTTKHNDEQGHNMTAMAQTMQLASFGP